MSAVAATETTKKPVAPSQGEVTWRVAPQQIAAALLFAVLMIWPLDHPAYDLLNTGVITCENVIVASSLVLLIGLVGQISLCQAALVGMGAFSAALSIHHLGLAFPFTLLVGAGAGALSAAVIGAVALRVRGLFFAVATMIFAYVADNYLFVQPWLVGSQSGTSVTPQTVGTKGSVLYLQLADAHNFYYIALACALLAIYAVTNLRHSPMGRTFSAVRGSEVAAASLGIDVVRTKMVAFLVAGGLAGLGGALTLTSASTIDPPQFSFTQSLFFLSIAVVGGLRSVGGVVSSSLLFALMVGELFYRVPSAANYLDLISSMLLLVVLLFFRGGLGALPSRIAPAFSAWARSRTPATIPEQPKPVHDEDLSTPRWLLRRIAPAASAAREAVAHNRVTARLRPTPAANVMAFDGSAFDVTTIAAQLKPAVDDEPAAKVLPLRPSASGSTSAESAASFDPDAVAARLRDLDSTAGFLGPDGRRTPVLLSAENVTVRFGGLTAVSNAHLQVGAGEIVGLIGPNGAGKTTMFNAILGLNDPAEGQIQLFGHDVSDWPVHRRAALGVGRTFQVLQLFPDLTVFDNLLAATWLQYRSGVFASAFGTAAARDRERAARERVRAVLDIMGLTQYADRPAGSLPFGLLRLVEVARTLVTGAKLICLDEPASGLDSAETEKFISWLQLLRKLGLTLLVIEHDVSMVVRLCDHIYVLDQGKLIAHGTPDEIRQDQNVIASYLGTPAEATA